MPKQKPIVGDVNEFKRLYYDEVKPTAFIIKHFGWNNDMAVYRFMDRNKLERRLIKGVPAWNLGKKTPLSVRKKQSIVAIKQGRFRKERNPMWKGGFYIDKDGYRRINILGKYPLEHRHLMEKYLNRKLKKSECVHHIDDDRLNNDISNLAILTRSEHMKLHHPKGRKFGT
jgi:hypothetical protein